MKFIRLFACFGVSLLLACTPVSPPASTSKGDTPIPTEESTEIPTQTPTQTPTPQSRRVTVYSYDDSGAGSLREALENAQDNDNIIFSSRFFPPSDPKTISVLSELPHIHASNLTLDASNAGVILDGSQIAGNWIAALQIVSASGVRIMGLQISKFPGPGIGISGDIDTTDNLIGGNPSSGNGPFGQGNLFSGNQVGINISTPFAKSNTITGNFVGTDRTGTQDLGNGTGIHICEAASRNTIGPNNVIAFNEGTGIKIEHENSERNFIFDNLIYHNGVRDILLASGGNAMLPAPVIYDYDRAAGRLSGVACQTCELQIFSTDSSGGQYYEGLASADEQGMFAYDKGEAFVGSVLTAVNSDRWDNTSEFSSPTTETAANMLIQSSAQPAIAQFGTTDSQYLQDNHIGATFDSYGPNESYDTGLYSTGITWARTAITGLEPELVDWSRDEFTIDPSHDALITRMHAAGLQIVYNLIFWDQANYPDPQSAPCARFETEEEIERYLEYVRFTVDHFKDRVQYYEIWNEPDIRNFCPKWIKSETYIGLVDRAADVIHAAYPDAKVVVGSVSNMAFPNAYDYLFDVIESDLIMPKVDVVAFHPMYGTSPEYELYYDYYYGYPSMVQKIKETAEEHGFTGEYRADEIGWAVGWNAVSDQPWVYSPAAASTYTTRGILMNLGLGLDVTYGSYYPEIRRLCTAMSGSEAVDLPIEIKSDIPNLAGYTFTLPDNGYMVALWVDGVAGDYDPRLTATLTIPDFSADQVFGDDPILGFEQELAFADAGGNLVIPDIHVKDYPILIKLLNAAPR